MLLLEGQAVDRDLHRLEFSARDLRIDLGRNFVDAPLKHPAGAGQGLDAQGLIGEGHVHDTGGMALGRGKVDEPALRQKINALAGAERQFLHVITRDLSFFGQLL